MSENTVYQSNRGPMVSQSNPSYITTDDIHIYEEIPVGKSYVVGSIIIVCND